MFSLGQIATRRVLSKLKHLLAHAVCAAVIFGFAATSFAEERPFAAIEKGTTNFSVYPFTTQATGVATHLGKFTKVGVLYLSPDPTDPTLLDATGTEIFTAANGDKLEVTITATLDTLTGVATGVGHFTGGTGRFADATGTIYLQVKQSPDGSFTGFAVGEIDY